MKKIPLFLFLFFIFSCKQNKELKTPVAENIPISKKNIEKDSVVAAIDFLNPKKKLWYQINELPFATYSGDNKYYYEVYFFAKNKTDYESIAVKLKNSSNEKIKAIVKNQNKFFKIAFLTQPADIEKAVENGETNYYPKFPSLKYIYLYDDYDRKWNFVDKVLYHEYDESKFSEIQKIIQNYLFQRLSSELTNKSLTNWTGSYFWDYDEGKNAAGDSTLSSYSVIIQNNNITYIGMGYQVDFKYSCLFENKGDTLNIYEYKNLKTNKREFNIFPLQILKNEKKYFTDYFGVRKITVKK